MKSLIIVLILPIFTLSSIYSTNASGAEQIPKSNLTESQLARGKTVGYLQAWPRIWTRDYREQIQLAVRAGLELGASDLQVQRFNHLAMLPLQCAWLVSSGFSCKYYLYATHKSSSQLAFSRETTPCELLKVICSLQLLLFSALKRWSKIYFF